ncbi:hypothetical protein WR25_25737 [Diploscapter pachys]|uniref:Uncharacterized protein n=1 Tax=Diploscapter pachys TaxID=2018661 RepID=A0A2A2K3L5_9BILA|nr:hypothetical protein WR25_25737 [Diploscapter pachys]
MGRHLTLLEDETATRAGERETLLDNTHVGTRCIVPPAGDVGAAAGVCNEGRHRGVVGRGIDGGLVLHERPGRIGCCILRRDVHVPGQVPRLGSYRPGSGSHDATQQGERD